MSPAVSGSGVGVGVWVGVGSGVFVGAVVAVGGGRVGGSATCPPQPAVISRMPSINTIYRCMVTPRCSTSTDRPPRDSGKNRQRLERPAAEKHYKREQHHATSGNQDKTTALAPIWPHGRLSEREFILDL